MKPKVYKRGRFWECEYYNALYRFMNWSVAIDFALRVAAGGIPDRFPVHISRDAIQKAAGVAAIGRFGK